MKKAEIVYEGVVRLKYRLPLIKNALKVLWNAMRGFNQTILIND